jgi:N-ethylmaleimide reductase
MNEIPPLLRPFDLGSFSLRNRVVMAPLTRRRATDDHVPVPLMATYYRQRASAGLIIAEATNISPVAVGYMNSPGIFNDVQEEAWKQVTTAVHERNGIIFLQLWHVGRISHPLLQPDGQLPVSASPIPAHGKVSTPEGHKNLVTPRALTIPEISKTIEDYVDASKRAIRAGFDGVEIHGANGYLPNQFLHTGSNIRSDRYGGSIKNRCRFVLEITEACCGAVGSEKVGIRLSPSGIFKDMFDDDPIPLYEYLISELDGRNLAYLHVMEPYVVLEPEDKYKNYLKEVTAHFRSFFNGPLITNVNYTFESGNRIISEGKADLVAFGKPFISNPDLVERFRIGAPLSNWDKNTFYYGGAKGYVDYPEMEEGRA